MKAGDIVICIDNKYETNCLTINKKYRILSIDRFGDKLKIKDDSGNDYFYYSPRRFKLSINEIRKQKLKKIYESR